MVVLKGEAQGVGTRGWRREEKKKRKAGTS